MEHTFWNQRWEENQIGFHLPETNPLLKKNLSHLGLAKNDKIFVPLCGKTLDMLYLKQQGYQVLGNELSTLAVNAFYSEHKLAYKTEVIKTNNKPSDLILYRSKNLEIINGDFFALEKKSVAGVRAVYDRASMVALPEKLRTSYVQHLLSLFRDKNGLIDDKITVLLITLEYDQQLKQGPPFSVTKKEVFNCYQNDFSINLLETQEIPMNQRGEVSKKINMIENVYLLHR